MGRPIDRIRSETELLHVHLEQLPYARAVLDGTLPREHYVSSLRALHVIHVALEHAIELAGDPVLRAVFGQAFARRGLLELDLATLSADPHAVDPAALIALVLAQRLRLQALREPQQLLGVMYVLEGSQLGGLVQHAALDGRTELLEARRYLAGLGRETRASFTVFVERLESALVDEAALERAVRGAVLAFDGFRELFEALDPTASQEAWPVACLNHEAGTHTIPEDLREVQAALVAGEESYRAFVYYRVRYGERGLRYTRSDSAWLASLVRAEPKAALAHIDWLGRVLAARGMPRLLLELHLKKLEHALARKVPERAALYQALGEAAGALQSARTRTFAPERAQALIESFAHELAAEAEIEPREAATLLTAALADAAAGIPNAVKSVQTWFTDAARFSPRWCRAVETLLSGESGPSGQGS